MQQPCPQILQRFPCFLLIIASISSFDLRTWNSLWLPPLPHLLLPNTGHFLSLSALISTILDPVWWNSCLHVLMDWLTAPPASPLCLAWSTNSGKICLCSAYNLNKSQWHFASIPVDQGLFNTDVCQMICIPLSFFEGQSDQHRHCFWFTSRLMLRHRLALSKDASSPNGVPHGPRRDFSHK